MDGSSEDPRKLFGNTEALRLPVSGPRTFAVDCSTCGKLFGPFTSYAAAELHAGEFRGHAHDCDATDKPGEVECTPPSLHLP